MRFRYSIVLLVFVFCGCENKQSQTTSTAPSARDPKLNKYFERYCDYTGSMGIGFVASHTYDFEREIVRTGKSSSRQMTTEERVSIRLSITERLDDLSLFDPGDPQREIAED